ncbi:rhodanese-like domain-containing protein [uncultured Jatrophihabitans sp.]|uniref:rhodanese-like domain-containing protein n=1 Tax=uncultured Jatrophihabitans sp. TaxID=1610747 RepID=UPI0035CA1DC3
MTRYVVIGAGAVGVSLAVELRVAGREVVLVGRPRQAELIAAGRLRYITADGTQHVDVPSATGPAEVALDRHDVLVLTTKTGDADAALAEWSSQPVGDGRHRAGDVLPVVTVQNGLDAERSALRRFATVIGAVVWIPSVYVTDDEVVSPGAPARGVFWLGAHPDAPATDAVARVADDLRAARHEVQVVDDLSRWKASKLVASSTFALGALYPSGPERDRAAELVRAETEAVLTAAGFTIADHTTEATVDLGRFGVHQIEGHERPGSSTWQSLARGRTPETDFLNGEVVLLARLNGLRAPVNAALQARVSRAAAEVTAPGTLDAADLATTLAAATVTVDPTTLRVELAGPQPPVVLDVRWALGDPDGEKHYLDAHLPGAAYVDLESELAAPASVEQGRHPLPDIANLQRAARQWGVRTGVPVVVYDDNGGLSAARAWWLLRWAGVADVRILDGGLGAWVAQTGQTESGASTPEPGDVVLTPGHLPVLDADAAAALPGTGVLIDARAAERYRGEVEPVDARAGHIPGAVSLPTADNLGPAGAFRSAASLRARFDAAGVTGSVGVYCGSGVTAAHEIAALHIAGIDAALYPGSWSQWSGDPSRPVATSADPS